MVKELIDTVFTQLKNGSQRLTANNNYCPFCHEMLPAPSAMYCPACGTILKGNQRELDQQRILQLYGKADEAFEDEE